MVLQDKITVRDGHIHHSIAGLKHYTGLSHTSWYCRTEALYWMVAYIMVLQDYGTLLIGNFTHGIAGQKHYTGWSHTSWYCRTEALY